jgi:VanZ family protein
MASNTLRALISTLAVLSLLTVVTLSVLPASSVHRSGLPKEIEHFAAYGGTALLFGLSFLRRTPLWVGCLLFMTLAGLLEYAQNWVPGRDAGLSTAVASVIGSFIGLYAVRVVLPQNDSMGKIFGGMRR